MTQIGCLAHAALALEGDAFFIGEGLSRAAFVIDDVVYKVELRAGSGENLVEHQNLEKWGREKAHLPIGFPKTTIWAVPNSDGGLEHVIAMPFVSGENAGICSTCYEHSENCGRCIGIGLFLILSEEGIYDTCEENIIRDVEGNFWLIDGVY